MNTGEKRAVKIGFPFGLYFRQLFFADTYVRYINPFSFWHRYKINHLETCRELNTVRYLENCHRLNWESVKSPKVTLNPDYGDSMENSLVKQAELNTIYISQPCIKLKYRGISYYSKKAYYVDIKIVEIDPSAVKSNIFKHSDLSDDASTPEKSGSN